MEGSMKLTNVIFPLVTFIAVFSAHAINITGVVKLSNGAGLGGVRVRLGMAAIAATTASDGSFSLKDNPTTGATSQFPHAARSEVCLEKNRLFFDVSEQTDVVVKGYDCNGKLLSSQKKTIFGEKNSITLPCIGSGVQVYRGLMKNEHFTFMRVAGAAGNRGPGPLQTDQGLTKRAKAASRIDDALLFIKQGYQLYRIAVTTPETSGLQITMVPLDTGTVSDGEGNVYKTVRIGNQYWTAENLRSTKYNDGSSIGSACYFYNTTTDAAAKKKWGALYTDAAANSGKLAPAGWRVPTGSDWDTLMNYLILHGYNYDGTTKGEKTAKSLAASSDWPASTDSGAIGNDLSLNNTSGFSALPAGWKFFEFEKQGTGAYFWIAGKGSANVLDIWWIFRRIDRYSTINYGASVRLVRHS
jgi:uncharacterized protein (TIGR02145 family)